MHFLRKILALFVIIGLIQPSARAGYMDFLEAERAFRAAPHDPAVVHQMLDLAVRQHNLLTTGYLQYFEQAGLFNPRQARTWSELPQSQSPHFHLDLLQSAFIASKARMNLENDPETLPSALKMAKKEIIPTLSNLLTYGTGHSYFLLYQLATQETMGERENTLQNKALEWIRKNKSPAELLIEAIRLGTLEALDSWDLKTVRSSIPAARAEAAQTPLIQAMRIALWMNDPEHRNSITTYQDLLRSDLWSGGISTQVITNGALLGDTFLQSKLVTLCTQRIQEHAQARDTLKGRRGQQDLLRSTLTQLRHATEHRALWQAVALGNNHSSTLMDRGEELFLQGGAKRAESRGYFERIVRHAPRSYEAPSAHVRLASFAAEEGNDDLVLHHTDAAKTLFADTEIFKPGQDKPVTAIEGTFLAADSLLRKETPKDMNDALQLLNNILVQHRNGEGYFGQFDRLPQLIYLLLYRSRIKQLEVDTQHVLDLLRTHYTHMLPHKPTSFTHILIRSILSECLSTNHPLAPQLRAEPEILKQLIRYNLHWEPKNPTNSFYSSKYYLDIEVDYQKYQKGVYDYFTHTTGLKPHQLWDMPSRDFQAYILSKPSFADPEVLANLAALLNQLGHQYWAGNIPEISQKEAKRRAVALFKKAAKLGDYMAMYNLSRAYQEGLGGLEANTEHAIGCLEIARKHMPNDVDVLRDLAQYYTILFHETNIEYDRAQLLQKSLETWEAAQNAGDPFAIYNMLLLQINAMHQDDADLDDIPSPRLRDKEALITELLEATATLWDHPDPTIQKRAVFSGYLFGIVCYWGASSLEMINAWEEGLERTMARLEETHGFDLHEALAEYFQDPRLAAHIPDQAFEVESEVEDISELSDTSGTPAAEETVAPFEESTTPRSVTSTSGTAEPLPEVRNPTVQLTPALIKKFRALFNGKMSHKQIKNLIQEFDRINNTNLWRFYRMSHSIHAGSGRRDTHVQERNRRISAIELFAKHANLTQEYIDMLTD